MEQSPSLEANSHTAIKEILHILCNPKVHYRVHKSPPLDLILSQPNPDRPIDRYLPKVHLNVTFGLPTQNPVNASPTRAACPAHLSLLDLITLTTVINLWLP